MPSPGTDSTEIGKTIARKIVDERVQDYRHRDNCVDVNNPRIEVCPAHGVATLLYLPEEEIRGETRGMI